MHNNTFSPSLPVGAVTCPDNSYAASPSEKPTFCKSELSTNPATELTLFSEKDAPALLELYINPETMRYKGGPIKTLPEINLVLEKYERQWGLHGVGPMAIREAATGSVIGRTGLRVSDSEEVVELFPLNASASVSFKLNQKYQIGWVNRPEFRNKGIATVAAKSVLDYAFQIKKVDEVAAFIRIENYPSVAVARKLKMSLVGSFCFGGHLWEYHSLTQENYSNYWK
jgi:RimJ/RimL family protein N-acetyltransferase